MSSSRWWKWRRPSRVTLIAAAVVIAGIALSEVSWLFFILVGVGAFGPGILRELGWLRDKDELQQRATQRAGYHAFLVAGLVACGLVAWIRAAEPVMKDPQELATLFLVLMWFTWFASSLFAYWGAQKTAIRILLVFGSFWFVFIVLSDNGSVVGFLMQSLLALPFFGLAFVARRWPRVAGLLLLAASIFFVVFFGWYEIGNQGLVTQAVTMILFLGPLLGSGMALLAVRPAGSSSNEGEDGDDTVSAS